MKSYYSIVLMLVLLAGCAIPGPRPAAPAASTSIASLDATATPAGVPPATLAPSPQPAATTSLPPARFAGSSCDFALPEGRVEGRNLRCGFVTLPADRSAPGGPTVELAVAVFEALGDSPRPDPIVFLDGGPGGETLGGTTEYFQADFAPELQEEHDLVFFDQRGVGRSRPALDCPEYTDALYATLNTALTLEQANARDARSMEACRQRLVGQGIDLAWFSSAASAADVSDMMRALGYHEWNLLGVSYGTRLALTILRDQPAGVRSVVLDSVYPPQVNRYVDLPGVAQRAFDTLFQGCAADRECAAAYPDLAGRFARLVQRLNERPQTAQVLNVFDGQTYDVRIDGDTAVEMLFTSLYITDYIPDLPELIARADAETAQGEAAALGEWGWVIFLFEGLSEGDYYAVECAEEAAFSSAPELAEAARAVPPEVGRVFGDPAFLEICASWAARPPDPRENQAVRSDVPVLLLSGEYDPVTPPAYARLAAETLGRAQVVEFPGLGHATFASPCPIAIITDFIGDPAAAPDIRCVATMRPPPFRTNR
jgi:pimeloyl-ACP methyl ester carboxylesterase